MDKRNDKNKKAAEPIAPSKKAPAAAKAVKGNAGAAVKKKPAAGSKNKPVATPMANAGVKRKIAVKKTTARAKASSIVLPPDYHPCEDEPFMNDLQRVYFRQKLLSWKDEIMRQTRKTLAGLHAESTQHADLADRATSETDRALELRARDRQRKLIAKIDAALARIEDGSYGYCKETGEPIGLKRLDARPIATLSVEAQERHERRERVYRED
jgi:DnaK suppressor protein